MPEAELGLPWPETPREAEEVTAELLAHVSTLEVEESGVSTEEQSGGLVVLRW